MLQIADGYSNEPDELGWMHFEGQPTDLQEGDVVMDGFYAIMRPPSRAQHNGKPAIMVTLALPQEYEYETRYLGGEPEERGRAYLPLDGWLRFQRQVASMDFGFESELHHDWLDDSGYEDVDIEWEGECKDVPSGLHVVFGEKAEVKIVDSVFPNGAVIFTDGTAYQSHPNRGWKGWLKEDETAKA